MQYPIFPIAQRRSLARRKDNRSILNVFDESDYKRTAQIARGRNINKSNCEGSTAIRDSRYNREESDASARVKRLGVFHFASSSDESIVPFLPPTST